MGHWRIASLYLLLLLNLCPASLMADPAAGGRLFGMADLLSIRRPREVKISPDGKYVAYTVEEPVSENNSKAATEMTLWLANVETGESIKCQEKAGGLKWSPDGKMITFLLSRPDSGGNQVFGIGLDGGPARQLTHFRAPIGSFNWSRDGSHICGLATRRSSPNKSSGTAAAMIRLT